MLSWRAITLRYSIALTSSEGHDLECITTMTPSQFSIKRERNKRKQIKRNQQMTHKTAIGRNGAPVITSCAETINSFSGQQW